MAGYIKLYRQMESWEWYTDVPTKVLFLHCLLRANHKPNKWRGLTIDTGSFVTSFAKLSSETGLSIREVRTSLNRLKSTHEVTHQTTSEYSVINIVKWADYQGCDDESDKANDTPNDMRATCKRHANDMQTTTNKNDKNDKNKNKDKKYVGNTFVVPTLDEVKLYCLERKNNINAENFIDFYTSKNWYIGKNKMKDWKACVRTWERNRSDRPKPSYELPIEVADNRELSDSDKKRIIEKMKSLKGE